MPPQLSLAPGRRWEAAFGHAREVGDTREHHHPLGALQDLLRARPRCRFRFTTLIFCCLIKGVKPFPPFLDSSSVPGFLTRGRRGASNKQGQSPAAPPAPAEGSRRRAERVAAHPPPRGTRGMPKNRRLSSTSSPQAHRGGFWVFFGGFFASGRAPRGAQPGLGAGRCVAGRCRRRTPNAPGGCHEAEAGNKKKFRAGSRVPSTTPTCRQDAGRKKHPKFSPQNAPVWVREGRNTEIKRALLGGGQGRGLALEKHHLLTDAMGFFHI